MWNLLNQAVTGVSLFVVLPHLVHTLGLTRYGIYSLGLTAFFLLTQIDAGVISTATRYFSVYAGANEKRLTANYFLTYTTVLLGLSTIVGAVIVIEAPTIVQLFNIQRQYVDQTTVYFRLLTVTLPVILFQALCVSLLQAHHRFRLIAIASVLTIVLRTVAFFVVVRSGTSLGYVAAIVLGQQALLAALLVVPSARYLSAKHLRFLPWSRIRESLRFGLFVQLSNVAALVNTQVDALLIGLLAPVKDVGIYNTGASVAGQSRSVLVNALYPIGARLGNTFGEGGHEAAFEELKVLQKRWVQITTALCCSLLPTGLFSIPAWLGPSFQLAGTVSVILLAAYAINLYTGMVTLYINAIGRPDAEARYGVVSMLVNIVVTAGLAVLGVLGIVSATAIGIIGGSFYLIRVVRRRVRPDIPNFLRDVPYLASVATVGVSLGLCLVLRGHVPHGVVGLFIYTAPAIPALAAFAVVLLSPRGAVRTGRQLLQQWRARKASV